MTDHRSDFGSPTASTTRATASGRGEGLVGGAVALDVPGQLGRPVPLVALRLGAVLRAGVPEAPVDEHRDLAPGERDVRADPAERQANPEILPVPAPQAGQRGPERELRL